jgi:hypothetical protein
MRTLPRMTMTDEPIAPAIGCAAGGRARRRKMWRSRACSGVDPGKWASPAPLAGPCAPWTPRSQMARRIGPAHRAAHDGPALLREAAIRYGLELVSMLGLSLLPLE